MRQKDPLPRGNLGEPEVVPPPPFERAWLIHGQGELRDLLRGVRDRRVSLNDAVRQVYWGHARKLDELEERLRRQLFCLPCAASTRHSPCDASTMIEFDRYEARQYGLDLPWPIKLCGEHASELEELRRRREEERQQRQEERRDETVRRSRGGKVHDIVHDIVYYLQLQSGLIKIGHTVNWKGEVGRSYTVETARGRLRAHCAAWGELKVLVTHRGGENAERVIHAQFRHLRIVGTELFRPGPDLLAHIGRIQLRRAS